MKLEIKHLKNYLDHKLKGLNTQFGDDDTVHELEGLYSYGDVLTDKDEFGIEFFKPILKSQESLSAKIEAEFDKYSKGFIYDQEIIDLFCAELIGDYYDFAELDFERLPNKTVEYIFRNHYDFFGLIPQNLAIDENTLK